MVKDQEKVSTGEVGIPVCSHMETTPENKGTLPRAETERNSKREELHAPERAPRKVSHETMETESESSNNFNNSWEISHENLSKRAR